MLAPAASVTIIDAENPSVRLVVTAPADAPLDLSSLLSLQPGESVYSIVTRLQTRAAGGMELNPDGSVSLSAASPSPAGTPTPGLAGGVLVYDAGRWVLRKGAVAQANGPAPAAQQARATIFKVGVTREEAERDIAQCRTYAEQAASGQARPAEKAASYNSTMYSCLRGFGYDIRI